MAYTKTTWNNLSDPPINADNLNKIEQGIYNNSLGIDKINPSGTATTTAEIEEGQINDVIGFKSLKLKGQTSQGENPTPDSPQEVNNVSGYNVVGISNKNVLPNPIQSQTLNGITITRNSDGTLLINGTATANTYFDFSTDFDTTKYAGYKFYGFPDNPGFFIRISKSNRVALQDISSNGTVISDNGTGNHIAIRIAGGANVNNRVLSPMIIAPTITDTTYTAHQGNNFEIDLGAIELCKIGDYADYIYKKDGKWWKHKEIEKAVLDGTENWAKSGNTSVDRFWLKLYDGTLSSFHNMFSNKFNYKYNVSDLNVAWIDAYQTEERLFVNYSTYNTTTLAQFKTWLASALPIFYYPIATPIEEEITYTPLIRQLDELYNSGLYDKTNISQDNSSEAFILDMEACKNNINGIVEYIRR